MIMTALIFKSAELFSVLNEDDDILQRGFNLSLSFVNEILAGEEYNKKKVCISNINKAMIRIRNEKIYHSSLGFIYSYKRDIQQHLEDALPEIDKSIIEKASEEIIKLITSENVFLSTRELFNNTKEVDMDIITCICLGLLFLSISWIFICKIKSEEAKQAIEILKKYYKNEKPTNMRWIEKIIKTIPFLVPKNTWTWEKAWQNADFTEKEKIDAINYLTGKYSSFSNYSPLKGEKFDNTKMIQTNNKNLPYVFLVSQNGLNKSNVLLEKVKVLCVSSDYMALDSSKSKIKEKFINKYKIEYENHNIYLSKQQMNWLDSVVKYSLMNEFIKELIRNAPDKDLEEIAEIGLNFNDNSMHSLEPEQANSFISEIKHVGLARKGSVLVKAIVHTTVRENKNV